MSILPILRFPDPRLREVSRDVTNFDAELKRLVTDMTDTMYLAEGAGLSAIQVGVPLRIFLVDPEAAGRQPTDPPLVFINPEIVRLSDEAQTGDEGCLSFPGIFVPVKRASCRVQSARCGGQALHGGGQWPLRTGHAARKRPSRGPLAHRHGGPGQAPDHQTQDAQRRRGRGTLNAGIASGPGRGLGHAHACLSRITSRPPWRDPCGAPVLAPVRSGRGDRYTAGTAQSNDRLDDTIDYRKWPRSSWQSGRARPTIFWKPWLAT